MNAAPTTDGQVLEFVNDEARKSRFFGHGRVVVFINGMANTGENHKQSALGLSFLQMCKVVGVFNATEGTILDLSQCLADKYQFDGPLATRPGAMLDEAIATSNGSLTRAQAMEGALAGNPATLSMFRVLRDPAHGRAPLYAHSQGNLILSNALSAVRAVDGDGALAGREIHSFGSPSLNWPPGIDHREYGFTFDPVTWLAGFDFSFRISKVGVPATPDVVGPLVSHGLESYMRDDPAFVINRFRWGGWGMTVSMDEQGLADALFAMGTNMQRVYPIFRRLESAHPSDVDDVAVKYVQKLRASPTATPIRGALKSHAQLRTLLVRAMKGGWTSAEEKSAIGFLEGL